VTAGRVAAGRAGAERPGQRLRRVIAGRDDRVMAVMVSGTTLAVEFTDGDTRVIRRTTTQPVRSIKGQRPRTATPIS
jgi:hypothetical protein